MSKLTAQDNGQNQQFKPKIYQGKRRAQTGKFFDKHNYDQRKYQDIDQSVQKEGFHLVTEYNVDEIT